MDAGRKGFWQRLTVWQIGTTHIITFNLQQQTTDQRKRSRATNWRRGVTLSPPSLPIAPRLTHSVSQTPFRQSPSLPLAAPPPPPLDHPLSSPHSLTQEWIRDSWCEVMELWRPSPRGTQLGLVSLSDAHHPTHIHTEATTIHPPTHMYAFVNRVRHRTHVHISLKYKQLYISRHV